MELLRQWLTGVTCAAIIVALADSLMAGGTVRKIGQLAGGLLLLAAVVKPVLEVDLTVLSAAACGWRQRRSPPRRRWGWT